MSEFAGREPVDPASVPQIPGCSVAAVYEYEDERSRLLYIAARYEPGPDGETKTFRQYRPGARGRWVGSLTDVRMVPYRLPQVLQYIGRNLREPLYIVEGEKDVHTLERLGKVATTNPMGAGKWKPEFSELLAGARYVIILADRDPIGLEHANAIRTSLAEVAGVTNVEVLVPRDGKDITEHLNSGYTLDDLQPLYDEPEPDPGAISIMTAKNFLTISDPLLEPLIGTDSQAVLVAGGLVILGGEAGTAKTSLSLDVLAHICSGTSWQGIVQPRAIRALMIENEGPRGKFREKLQEKVKAWDGDPFLDNLYVYAAPWGRFSLAEEAFRHNLMEYVAKHRIDLVVADPLGSLGVEGVGAPDETRRFVAILKGMGLFDPQQPVAFWFPHHYSKQHAGGSVIAQLSGDWGAHADTVIGVKQEGKKKSHLTWAKARWCDDLHGTTWIMQWEAGGTYSQVTPEVGEEVDDSEILERIVEYLSAHGATAPTRLAKDVKGNQQRIKDVAAQAGAQGVLDNAGTADRPRWTLPTPGHQEELLADAE